MAKPGPLIALAAGAAFLLMRKGGAAPEPVIIPEEDIPPPPPTAPKYEPPPPCIHDCKDGYDNKMWSSRQDILDGFAWLGYVTPDPPQDTMNALGPDGKLGGGDDVKSAVVESFQRAYNRVSRAGTLDRSQYGGNKPMGLLRPDGYVGPKTLNGLEMIIENIPASITGPAGSATTDTEHAAVIAWWRQLSS
jgi:hypothetical protein